jgi:hypothetical protein
MRFVCLYLCAAIAAWPADSRNIDPPNTNTHFKMPEYKTLAQWEARKKQLKEQIQFWAGLDPMPERAPVRSEIFGRIREQGLFDREGPRRNARRVLAGRQPLSPARAHG